MCQEREEVQAWPPASSCFSTDPSQKTKPPPILFSSTACHVRPCNHHTQGLWVSNACPSEPQFYHLHRGEFTSPLAPYIIYPWQP